MSEDPKANQDQIVADLTSLADRAKRLGRYASDVIQMVRDTRKTVAPTPQDMKELLDWAIRVARPEGAPPLHHEYEGELRPVIADRHFLQLALLNVVQNAVKYARPGVEPSVLISQASSRSATGGPEERLITKIRDNGIGIPKQDLRKVFQPFVRGSGQTKKDGFGLGLSMVAKVISLMNGRV